MNYLATTKNNIITSNTAILPDGFASIYFKNIGTDNLIINDNIPIESGQAFSFDNHPNVIIEENISLRFTDSNTDKKVLVIKTYFKEKVR